MVWDRRDQHTQGYPLRSLAVGVLASLSLAACEPAEGVESPDTLAVDAVDPLLGIEGPAIAPAEDAAAVCAAIERWGLDHPGEVYSATSFNSTCYVYLYVPEDWNEPDLNRGVIGATVWAHPEATRDGVELRWSGDGLPAFPALYKWSVEVSGRDHASFSGSFTDARRTRAAYVAADAHRVRSLLGPLLTGSWFNTGDGSLATLALLHQAMYPDDVVGTFAFHPALYNAARDARPTSRLTALMGTPDPANPQACIERHRLWTRQLRRHRDQVLKALETVAPQDSMPIVAARYDAIEHAEVWRRLDIPDPCAIYDWVPSKPADIEQWVLTNIPIPGATRLDRDLAEARAPVAWLHQLDLGQPDFGAEGDAYSLAGTPFQDEVITHDPRVRDFLQSWLADEADHVVIVSDGFRPSSATAPSATDRVWVHTANTGEGGTSFTSLTPESRDRLLGHIFGEVSP